LEEEESDDEFCDRTTAPVPKWEVLAYWRGSSSASNYGWVRGIGTSRRLALVGAWH
jgi:hypothetical protein